MSKSKKSNQQYDDSLERRCEWCHWFYIPKTYDQNSLYGLCGLKNFTPSFYNENKVVPRQYSCDQYWKVDPNEDEESKSERVSQISSNKVTDSQADIDFDSKLTDYDYCAKWHLTYVDPTTTSIAVRNHILDRQRRLQGVEKLNGQVRS